MADKYWPDQDPLGKRIELDGPNSTALQVVGVVRTTKYSSFNERPLPVLFMPMAQSNETFMYLFAATHGDAPSFIPAIRNAVRDIDPAQPIYDIRTMS